MRLLCRACCVAAAAVTQAAAQNLTISTNSTVFGLYSGVTTSSWGQEIANNFAPSCLDQGVNIKQPAEIVWLNETTLEFVSSPPSSDMSGRFILPGTNSTVETIVLRTPESLSFQGGLLVTTTRSNAPAVNGTAAAGGGNVMVCRFLRFNVSASGDIQHTLVTPGGSVWGSPEVACNRLSYGPFGPFETTVGPGWTETPFCSGAPGQLDRWTLVQKLNKTALNATSSVVPFLGGV